MKTAKNLNFSIIGVGTKNYEDFKKENIEILTENWENFHFEIADKKLLKSKKYVS